MIKVLKCVKSDKAIFTILKIPLVFGRLLFIQILFNVKREKNSLQEV